MRNYNLICIFFIMSITSSLSKTPHQSPNDRSGKVNDSSDKKNIVIVYLSRTGNTRAIGPLIQKQVGGKLIALDMVTPYPRITRRK
jgi:hypothetical protein